MVGRHSYAPTNVKSGTFEFFAKIFIQIPRPGARPICTIDIQLIKSPAATPSLAGMRKFPTLPRCTVCTSTCTHMKMSVKISGVCLCKYVCVQIRYMFVSVQARMCVRKSIHVCVYTKKCARLVNHLLPDVLYEVKSRHPVGSWKLVKQLQHPAALLLRFLDNCRKTSQDTL